MSWFSNRFPVPFKPPEDHNSDSGSDEEDDQGNSTKGGVKEDLSELTKTFTRQLWGVASFLAPPPQTKRGDEDESGDDDAQVDAPLSPRSDPPLQAQTQIEASLSNELVDVDFHGTSDHSGERYADHTLIAKENSNENRTALEDMLAANQNSEHGLTGISKDLAELKGSVTTGLSKFLRVVRDEIERDNRTRQQNEDDDIEDEDNDDENANQSRSPTQARTIPGFNSLFKPLINTILQDDKHGNMSADEYEDDGEDPSDLQGHEFSRPGQRTQLSDGIASITKFASSLFPVNLDSDDESENIQQRKIRQAVGVTDEVLAFAKNISMHPETWLDFPLFTDDDDNDDFDMSDAQKDHVDQVELASPRLAALRIELCPDYMTESRFWKIYFVLLHSRLSKTDAVLLSTPQIIEARALLLKKLQKGASQDGSNSSEDQDNMEGKTAAESFKIVSLQSAMAVPAKDFGQIDDVGPNLAGNEKSVQVTDSGEEVQNKTVLASTVKLAALNYEEEEEDADRWLDDEPSPHLGSGAAGLTNEDDVSFSDLEEDDESTSKTVATPSSKRSYSWVQLNKNQGNDESLSKAGSVDTTSSKVNHGVVPNQSNAIRKHNRGESSDWSTVEEDDVLSADFA